MERKKNPNIHCTVDHCCHNLCSEHYCTLDMVNIGTHESNPTKKECVDCDSFEMRSGCCDA